MAFEKYGFLDGKIKEALVAHRKETTPYHAEYTDLIAERIRLLEEKLMSKTLTFQEIDEMQEELNNLKEGKITEAIIALHKEAGPINSTRDEKHKPALHSGHLNREQFKKTLHTSETTPEATPSENTDEVFTFDDMRLKVEDRLQLEPTFLLSHERFTVRVIGYRKGGSIIVTAPIGANGLRVPLSEKEKVIIRSFSGQNAFAFVSTILRINNISFDYLHLSIPDTIQGIKIRKVTRVRSNIITTVQNSKHDAKEQISAIIADICADGVSLMSKLSLGDKGDTLHLAFRAHVHNVEALLSVNGIIRTMSHDDVSANSTKPVSFHYGIEFQDLQSNESVILQSMIYQQMIENPHAMM